jgi:translation elongation factor EF-Ts
MNDALAHLLTCAFIFGLSISGLGRLAGLVTLEAEDSTALLDAVKEVGSSIAMHIVAAKPLFLSKELVSAAAIDNEREILRTQVFCLYLIFLHQVWFPVLGEMN